MHLTERNIEAAEYAGTGNARDVRWDDEPRGLGVRIYPSGRKAFIYSYRNKSGVKRLVTIGDFPTWTLKRARAEALRLAVGVDEKRDPAAERRSERLEAKTGTVAALVAAYIEARTQDRNRPMKRPEAVQWCVDKFIVPTFGSRPWRDVRRSEVREWHARIAKAYNANRALQAMRAAFYWRLWQEDDAAGTRRRESDTRNPCAGIDLRPETRRQVRLELTEWPKLEKAIDAETEDTYLRAFFRFVLFTGCRRSEALQLRWSDVALSPQKAKDAANGVTFRDVKAGGDHTVPLSPDTAALLRELPRVEGNPFVFVGRKHGAHLESPAKAWQRIRKAAGLPGLRIHDLRRSFGSWLGDAGFTSKQIGAALGHKSDITSRVYMALGDQSKRQAVDAVQALIASTVAKGKAKRKSAKVLQFPKAARV